MKLNLFYSKLILLLLLTIHIHSFGQDEQSTYRVYNFIYVDNSKGTDYGSLNDGVKNALLNEINNQKQIDGSYFYFYLTNGSEAFRESDVTKLDSATLEAYIKKATYATNYESDNEFLHKLVSQNPPVIKDQINIYFFLSAEATRRVISEVNNMPTPVVFPAELSNYINPNKKLNTKLIVITNREIQKGYTEDNIKRAFGFGDNQLSGHFIQPKIEFR